MSPAKPSRKAAQDSTQALSGRKVLLGVTGGVACYKSAALTSLLVQAGAQVRVIMTEAATKFVAPLTFQSLSGNTVLTSVWQADDRPDSQHIGLARWCDVMVIAPATADIIARLAAGLTDDLVCLTAAALPRTPKLTPLLLAPAMNADMWASPVVQRNLATIKNVLGYSVVGPEKGWQACRTSGLGRMSEPQAIFDAAAKLLPAK